LASKQCGSSNLERGPGSALIHTLAAAGSTVVIIEAKTKIDNERFIPSSPDNGSIERGAPKTSLLSLSVWHRWLFELARLDRRELHFRQLDPLARALCNFRVKSAQFGAVILRLLAKLRSLPPIEAPFVRF
jgi:hypothetical protein